MKKQMYGLFAVLLVATMLLAACKPAATPQPVENTAVPVEQPTEVMAPEDTWENVDPSGQEIIFWHQHSKERETALLEIVDEFNQTNEWGITVTAEYQGSYGDIFNKMLGVLDTPDAPDIVVAYQNQAATYQLSDALFDINQVLDSPKWGLSKEEQADFFPGFFAQDVLPTFGYQRLGFPPNRSMEVLYYNMDWLKEMGYDAPPSTPEQFKEMACKAVDQPFSKATVEGAKGYELSIDASRWASWTFAFGGDIYDYTANKFTYDSEGSQQALSFISDLISEGCATQVTEAYGDQTDFGNGSLLFAVGSSSGLPFYGSAVDAGAQFEWSVAAIPHTTPDPVMNVYGASVSIPKTTPERELAAWLFIKYYTTPEVQAKWATVSQYFPVRQSAVSELDEVFNTIPGYKTAFDMLEYSHFEPPVPGYDFVRNEVSNAMAAIVDGAEVPATLEGLNVLANEILAEQMSQTSAPPPPPTPEPTPVVTIGTEAEPIKVLFVPSVDVNFMIESGKLMEASLHDATGLYFKVSVPTSYAATIEEMCASPTDTIGFIPALGYALANQLCGVEPGLASERFGWNVYWTEFLVQRDSEFQTLEDLQGATWAYPDAGSTSGYLYPKAIFDDLGVELGNFVEAGGHPQSVKAVYNGEADVATAYFSAPLLPEGTWEMGDNPDIPDELVSECAPDADGKLFCGGYRVLDARSAITTEAPDVVQKVRILSLSGEIPNDTMSFSPDFPESLRQVIMDALIEYIKTDACLETLCNEKFYNWTGAGPIFDENFDGVRLLMAAQGITLENLGN
jgi:multiple sugar transport system substrate-binding protein/sn-glycerol 3-phosphate transport system substrate-binding protein